jgi:hypothetical protein
MVTMLSTRWTNQVLLAVYQQTSCAQMNNANIGSTTLLSAWMIFMKSVEIGEVHHNRGMYAKEKTGKGSSR